MAVLYLRDQDLVQGLKNGESQAFEALLDIYGDRIVKTCYLILKNSASADDAAQEVFLQIFKSIKKFKEDSLLYTWIYKITINKCRDLLKKRNEYSPIENMNMPSEIDVEYEVIENADKQKVRDTVFAMSPIYREVVTLFYFEDMSVKDICTVLDESEGTVKSKLHRARNILKQVLIKEGRGYGRE